MGSYYADSSVLIKRHVREVGTDWVQTITDPASGNEIMTAHISVVEVFSAFNRRVREAHISIVDYKDIADDFELIVADFYQLVGLSTDVVSKARELLERHPLRAYDAVQLASALISNTLLVNAGAPALTFLSADTRLLAAAQSEGLPTDNPEQYTNPAA
jgi:hypothetical protein